MYNMDINIPQHEFTNCSQIQQPSPSSRRQKGDMKQVQNWGPKILERPVDVTVIWRSVLCACEPVHIFVRKGKTEVIMLKILGTTVQNLIPRYLRTPALKPIF